MMRRTFVVGIAVLALVGAACSSSDSGGAASSPAAVGTSPPASTETCTAATATDASAIIVENFRFRPDCGTISAGSTFTVENKDAINHTFTIDGTSVDLALSGDSTVNGKSASLAPGTYPFHCSIHPTITGTLIVG